jgi:hypothetical protein
MIFFAISLLIVKQNKLTLHSQLIMQVFQSKILLEQLRVLCQKSNTFLQEQVLPLTLEQCSWQPNPKSWSILQIFAHLNASSNYYQNGIEKKINEQSNTQPSETFVSSPLGRATWQQVKLGKLRNTKRRIKSAKVFNPIYFAVDLKQEEISNFSKNMQQLQEILQKAENINLRKVKLPMAVSKFVNLRLGDALMFHVYHIDRHMEQINQLLKHPKFPK